MDQLTELKQRIHQQRGEIIQFMRDICAIPSMNSQIGPVGERIQAEMRKLGWEGVRFDKMGNTMGRIGNGPKVIVYDSHIDTVGVGDPNEWEWDPFVGKVEDGILYARGACDEKNSTPGMVYGLAIARDLGLLDGYTVYYFGNMEEWCDGIAPNTFVGGRSQGAARFRGHRRTDQDAGVPRAQRPHRDEGHGVAAGRPTRPRTIWAITPCTRWRRSSSQIRELDRRFRFGMGSHPMQGMPSIAVTDVQVRTASLNAVPDKFTIYLDRRITSTSRTTR